MRNHIHHYMSYNKYSHLTGEGAGMAPASSKETTKTATQYGQPMLGDGQVENWSLL